MAEKFVLLKESDYEDLIKLKEKHDKRNKYHNEYNKNKLQEIKQNDPELFKLKMAKQNEANKIYKQNLLLKIKQDPEAYKQYNIKMSQYRQSMAQVKRNLLKSLENYEAAT